MSQIKIVGLSGSLRRASWNTMALRVAAEGARAAGASVDLVSAAELDLPMFNEDVEAAGMPSAVLALRERLKAADGLLLACPEYNASITPALKNAIDWASRPREGEARMACFAGKAAGLISASPGRLGGVRGLPEVARILWGVGVTVSATYAGVGEAHTKFAADGSCIDEGTKKALAGVGAALVKLAGVLRAG